MPRKRELDPPAQQLVKVHGKFHPRDGDTSGQTRKSVPHVETEIVEGAVTNAGGNRKFS